MILFKFSCKVIIALLSVSIMSCQAKNDIELDSNLNNHIENDAKDFSLSQSATSKCKPGLGWDDVLKYSPEGFYFFGEMHGTNEVAPLVVEFSCILSETSNKPTLVLFEVDSFNHSAFSKIYNVAVDDRRNFLIDELSHFWFNDTQDGRRTEAIMQAMLRILELNDKGLPIYLGSVGATDEQYITLSKKTSDKSIYEYEFENLVGFQNDFTNIVTLTGNWHTFRYAHRMSEKRQTNWIAFDQVFMSGKGLNCMGECKANDLGTHRLASELENHPDFSYIIFTGAHKLFDGYFLTKETTAANDLSERKKLSTSQKN